MFKFTDHKVSTIDRHFEDNFKFISKSRDSLYFITSFNKILKKSLFNTRLSRTQRKYIFTFLKNYSSKAIKKRNIAKKNYGIAPETFVLELTEYCNLNCKYCYSKSNSLACKYIDVDTAEIIINEMEDLFGIRYVTVTGGEPFPYILEVAKRCRNSIFNVYTNGTQIDDIIAKKIKKLGNIIPSVSLVGNQEIHDSIRGKGSFQNMMLGVNHLVTNNIIWGFSITESGINIEDILNGKLLDLCNQFSPYLIRMIPFVEEGRTPKESLALTSTQRRDISKYIFSAQKKYDFLIYDYVNDKRLGISCMAGGIRYFNITPELTLTPCVFMNIGDKIKVDYNNKSTNILDLLSNSTKMNKSRKLGNMSNCVVIDEPRWREQII